MRTQLQLVYAAGPLPGREIGGAVGHCFPVWLICRGLQSKFDLKSRSHAVESLAVDAEDFGGALTVAPSGFEHVENVAPLQFVQARQSRKEVGKIVG